MLFLLKIIVVYNYGLGVNTENCNFIAETTKITHTSRFRLIIVYFNSKNSKDKFVSMF